ncbi:hypothetical protein GCM10011613_12910 [Cellvibrio zantedeschiae]|uniref:RanBP2-type domain-containing protein n=1 Tax=Cellvibrio zantedeschiae TaxID=1237077 RepID=A0ABQ3AYN2_9GAMM|nr:DUF2007 domain-containing protein [Cellvibrio zantedeschiae]GGY69955.1 hypothetical protein GCM10011613_12910 [Cellvibrio zantedeschiae]
MKLIYTHENRLLVSNVKNILENSDIAVTLKNEYVGSASGDLSFLNTWPEVWVLNENDYERAMHLVNAALTNETKNEWTCPGCNETNAATFDLCWNCQKENVV